MLTAAPTASRGTGGDAKNRFVADAWPTIVEIARRWCIYPDLYWDNDRDDLISRTAQAAAELWDAHEGHPPPWWPKELHHRAHFVIRDYAESGEVTAEAEATGTKRRRRSAYANADDLRAIYGSEPTDEEIVEHLNGLAMAGRADPKKQGALASASDLEPFGMVPTDPDALDPVSLGRADNYASALDVVADAIWLADCTEEILDRAREANPLLGRFAEIWLASVVDADPISCAGIAARIGVSRSTAERMATRVRAIAAEAIEGG